MWLREKKYLNSFQTNVFPTWKKELSDILWSDLDIIIDWDSVMFDTTPYGENEVWYTDVYHRFFTEHYFNMMKNVLTTMCADDFTKDALKAWLKAISISGINESSYPRYEMNAWTLLMKRTPIAAVWSSDEKDMQTFIENNL